MRHRFIKERLDKESTPRSFNFLPMVLVREHSRKFIEMKMATMPASANDLGRFGIPYIICHRAE